MAEGPLPGAVPAVFADPGEQERAMAAPLLAALPGATDLCGRLNVPEAAACLSRCALYVGNDSGLMRLAAAGGTPTLGLFGPTPVAEYAPAGRCAAAVVAAVRAWRILARSRHWKPRCACWGRGAFTLWVEVPPGQWSVGPVAGRRLGWVTGWVR